ncbi:MAG: methylmalonyl Co-A mutase-associated GTPase MeaB [Acidobacteriota bacterium]|nr:methylmalonyl Co-A mutase-associated GTPase MeaB [Acidobacteriota bacterium]
MELVQRLLAGDVRALARAISRVESDSPDGPRILREVFPRTGRATVLGVTGAPGSGKSTLVDRLIGVYRERDCKVGIVAVDPSSAYSGGAILGDRVRMQQHASDAGVFIRSMATRGHLGGLCRAANDAIDLMDAAGYDPVIVETVGVGQDEVEIARAADAVAVVLVPGLGDDIQAIKAGILEIADVFVVNKADLVGADRLVADLEYMLSLAPPGQTHTPEILRTVAVGGEGVDALIEGLERFLASSKERRAARRRERAEARFLAVLSERLVARVRESVCSEDDCREIVDAITERRVDPYSAVERILGHVEVR